MILMLLLTPATALASGSFSAVIDPLALHLDTNLEVAVGEVEGWSVFAGSGFAVSPAGVEKLQPYTLACQVHDLAIAASELCVELRAPLIGEGSISRLFLSIAW